LSVYVDDLVDYGVIIGRCGPNWCHMIADTLAELHFFATIQIGLKRSWFQDKRTPHYDLTAGKRAQAIKKGALQNPDAFERCMKMWMEVYRRKKVTEHDRFRKEKAERIKADPNRTRDDVIEAIGALQSTDDPSLLPLHDELMDELHKLDGE
jgi:Protein of unknown function (DUF4031)